MSDSVLLLPQNWAGSRQLGGHLGERSSGWAADCSQAAGCGVAQGPLPPGSARELMELSADGSQKENVSPRPAVPLRPEQRRLPKSLGVVLGSGHGRWVPRGQAERGEPATTPWPGAMLRQEPCQVQTNLASPRPHLGLTLKDTTGRLINSRFQQSNLQPLGGRPRRAARAGTVQQSNLSVPEAGLAEWGRPSSPLPWSEPQESFWPHMMPWGSPLPPGPLARPSSTLKQSPLLATDSPCPGVRPPVRCAPVDRHTQPGPRSWSDRGNWTSGLLGAPLTLEDLAVPGQSWARAPSQAAVARLLASVQHLEHEVAQGLRCGATQGPPRPSQQQEPWASGGQALPARPQRSQPALAFCDQRTKHPPGLGGAVSFPVTRGVRVGLTDSQASGKTALEVLAEDCLDPERGVLPACTLRRGERPAYSRGQRGYPLLPQGTGSGEASLCSPTFSRAPWGALPMQEGREKAPREQVSREEGSPAPCLTASAPATSTLQNRDGSFVSLESETAGLQLLSRCFRAWQHVVRRRPAVAVAEAVAPGRRPHRDLQALRWARWLQDAELEVAWSRHTRALPAQSFQKWRDLTRQQKQGQPHFQAGPGPEPSGGGQGQGPSGRKPVVDAAQRSSPGFLREEAGPQPIPRSSGLRPDGGDERVQILQVLQRLAVFLLQSHQKERARQEEDIQREASGVTLRTQSVGRPQAWCCPAPDTAWVAPLHPQHQRAWLRRCFRAWLRWVKRGAQDREHLAGRQTEALRMCLEQGVCMKQLQDSDGAEATQPSLCRQKEGLWSLQPGLACKNMDLSSSAPGRAESQGLGWAAPALGLPQERSPGSPQEACPRLALQGALLLWRARLSQRQRADSFVQGMQWRVLRHILRAWRWRALEKASRAPALLETLRLSFLGAAGRQQQARCLLRWRARAQQSRRAARWHQHTLQRRVLLSWSHWAVAQGARRKLAARWARDRSCRAALGLWRRRLEQRREAELWAQERGWRRARDALQHWHASCQRQQRLQEQYRQWAQRHLQGLRRAAFQSWQWAAAHRRLSAARPERLPLQSHFQTWCGSARAAGVPQGPCPAFQDGLRRRVLKAPFATWREGRVATAWARERCVAQASIARWRSLVQGVQADQRLRRAQGQRALAAWRVALGQRAGERAWAQTQAGLCWALWGRESRLHRLSRAHAARKLSARVLEAWAWSDAQGHVQRVAITQFQLVGHRHPLRTRWALWRTALLLGAWLEPSTEAQETGSAHPRPVANLTRWSRLASRGRHPALMDTAAPLKQTRSCRPPGTGPMLPSLAQHHGLGGQRKWREASRAQGGSAVQRWVQWPGPRAQGQPPPGPGGACSSEASALRGQGQVDRRWLGRKYLRRWHLEALLRRLQGSQQAGRLAATWQRWVDAQGEDRLARSLLRQWHLRRAWRTWRRRVVRLQVARRLQQRDDGRLLSQAFKKWHQNLAARGLRSYQQPQTPE